MMKMAKNFAGFRAAGFRTAGLLLVGAAALLLSGCFGGSDKVVRYYTLPIPAIKNGDAAAAYPYTLMVTQASVDPAYRRNNIVYRESPYDFMFYTYSVWAARPEFLVEQSVTSMVKSAAIFKVLDVDESVKPDLEFTTHVNAIEEVDVEKSRLARLAVTFTLRKTDAEDFIWRRSYDESKQYDGSDMRNFAEAIYGLLQKYMDDALNSVKSTMASVPAESIKTPEIESAAPEEPAAVDEVVMPEEASAPEPELAPAAE